MTRTFALPRNAFLGFDHIFDELERIQSHAKDTYPPHNVEVVGADLKDGILSVNLAVKLPEEQKPKLIKIAS